MVIYFFARYKIGFGTIRKKPYRNHQQQSKMEDAT